MPKITFTGNTEFNVLYFSDVHANTKNLPHFKTAVDSFNRINEGKRTLKLAGGDLNVDIAIKPNKFILKFMDLIGLDASSFGNHDIEGGDYFAQAVEEAKPKFKFLSSNLNFSRKNEVEEKIAKSTIIEKDGERVGVIGVSPVGYGKLTNITPFNDYIAVKSFGQTLRAVRQEVRSLEKKSINKIFLLAHTGKTSNKGFEYYEYLAKIGGIDVIIGGHDHIEHNLWYESERKDKSGKKEPVKVVSTGKAEGKNITGEDLGSFGVLKAVFDDNGILVKDECHNDFDLSQKYAKSQEIVDWEEKELETGKVIGHTDKDLKCIKRGTEENPVADLAADAMLWIVNRDTKGEKAQIAFVNSGTIRGDFSKGEIKIGQIRQAVPFTATTLIKTTLTKKQIMDTLNWCVESTTHPKITPGLMQVGGMKYTIGRDKKVKDVYLTDKAGKITERIDDKPDNKRYNVIHDVFLMTGVAGLSELKKEPMDPTVEYFPYSRQDALIEYLTENFKDKPVKLKTGRIKIEK